jgi:hypothetical protein
MNGPTPRFPTLLRNERGGVLALVVASLVILLGLVAFAVDLGIMYTARAEAQRAADSGAHAGAGVFLLAPSNWTSARTQARDFAESNPVRWAALEVLDEDIDVIPDSQKVRVRVHRREDRGTAIPTLFARILGIETVNVGAVAAAQSWPSDGTDCMLPFAIPDRWDVFENGQYRPSRSGDVYDPDRGDRYYSPAAPREDGYYTGYGRNSIGESFLLKPKSPAGSPQPEWYYPIRLDDAQGADDYRDAVADCWQPGNEVVLGDQVVSEPGNMSGPTRQGFLDIMDDPEEANIYWDEACGCPRNQEGNMVGTSSRRVRPLVMFHPEDWEDIHLGAMPVPVRNFAGVFIDRVDPNGDVWIRWMQYTTVRSAANWEPDNGSLLRSLRIVE